VTINEPARVGVLGPIAYGALFCLGVPALLVAWSSRLDAIHELPDPLHDERGMLLVVAGFALAAWSMLVLRRRGGGLPMNAYPTVRRVDAGPYALLAHPIYAGFVVVVLGAALAGGSAAALWVAFPASILGCAALVIGYEEPALRTRFPGLRDLDDRDRLRWSDRIAVVAVLFLPWAVGYTLVGRLPQTGAFDPSLELERSWSVLPWAALVYSSVYPLVLAAAWTATTRATLWSWVRDAWCAIVLGFLVLLVLPSSFPPKPVDPDAFGAALLALERSADVGAANALPSFHTAWAVLAGALAGRTLAAIGAPKRATIAVWAWVVLIALSCVAVGMHAIADVVAGALLAATALARRSIWAAVVGTAERFANAAGSVRLGPIRIFSHAPIAGAASAAGIVLAASFAGDEHALAVGGLAVVSLLGAGAWGQILIGGWNRTAHPSTRLLRPFGFFGSVFAVLATTAIVAPFADDLLVVAAAIAAAAPVVQAIGRLRCLQQGCCHGAPIGTRAIPGIRHVRPQSRVCRIAGLCGIAIHPTPVYSIAANLAIALLLARMWSVGAATTMVLGAACILSGAARFCEERFRGEPQTRVFAGLRLYQWLALALVAIGIAITCVPGTPVPAIGAPGATTSIVACIVFVLHAIAMGVDCPESTRRFARLAD
jgi:protein-S-isoprenylcysteine O-methyltransferase Ste14